MIIGYELIIRKEEKSQTPEDEQAIEEDDDVQYQKFREAMNKQVKNRQIDEEFIERRRRKTNTKGKD